MKPQRRPIIRQATQNDLEAIFEIEKKCFSEQAAYSKRHLAYLVFHANSTCLVETYDGTIRGFVIAIHRKNSLTSHIETIDVDPACTKSGIGQRLLTSAEEDMRKRGKHRSQLEVSAGNKKALSLYKKSGYTIKEKLHQYYKYDHQGTRDALRMIKPLEEDQQASKNLRPTQ